MAAEKAAQEEGQPGVDGKGHEADGVQADDHGRHKLGQLSFGVSVVTRTAVTHICMR